MKLLFFFVLVISAITAQAQYSESIVSDRPGQGNSPLTVGKGVVQLQSGFGLSSFHFSFSVSFSEDYWELNKVARFGISERFEVSTHLAYGYLSSIVYDFQGSLESDFNGLSGMAISGRYNALNGDGWKPSIGFQGGFALPWLSNVFKGNYVSPTVAIMASLYPTQRLGILVNLGGSLESYELAPSVFYVFNAGYQLFPKLSLFIETYGEFTNEEFTNKFDGGIAYLANNNLQLDFFAGYKRHSITTRTWFWNLGISWRINTRK